MENLPCLQMSANILYTFSYADDLPPRSALPWLLQKLNVRPQALYSVYTSVTMVHNWDILTPLNRLLITLETCKFYNGSLFYEKMIILRVISFPGDLKSIELHSRDRKNQGRSAERSVSFLKLSPRDIWLVIYPQGTTICSSILWQAEIWWWLGFLYNTVDRKNLYKTNQLEQLVWWKAIYTRKDSIGSVILQSFQDPVGWTWKNHLSSVLW